MKVVVAMDSFEGSLSSKAAGNAVRAGVLSVASDADVQVFEVADGGEGTPDAIRSARRGTKVSPQVLSESHTHLPTRKTTREAAKV